MIKILFLNFLCFTLFEGFIYLLFFKKNGKIEKLNILDFIFISIGNFVICSFLPNLLYQVVLVGWMSFYLMLRMKKEDFSYFVLVLLALIYLLIIEMIYNLIMSYAFNLDGFVLHGLRLFVMMLPVRFLEIFGIYMLGGDKMKTWLGAIKKRK